jgi:hypothetical protein
VRSATIPVARVLLVRRGARRPRGGRRRRAWTLAQHGDAGDVRNRTSASARGREAARSEALTPSSSMSPRSRCCGGGAFARRRTRRPRPRKRSATRSSVLGAGTTGDIPPSRSRSGSSGPRQRTDDRRRLHARASTAAVGRRRARRCPRLRRGPRRRGRLDERGVRDPLAAGRCRSTTWPSGQTDQQIGGLTRHLWCLVPL